MAERDCKHGQLARSCPICEAEAALSACQEEVKKWRDRAEVAEDRERSWTELEGACQEELARVRAVIEEMKHDGDDYVLNYAERLDRALSSEATKGESDG